MNITIYVNYVCAVLSNIWDLLLLLLRIFCFITGQAQDVILDVSDKWNILKCAESETQLFYKNIKGHTVDWEKKILQKYIDHLLGIRGDCVE